MSKQQANHKPLVYIAAPWVDRELMPAIAAQVEALGADISHKWWEVDGVAEGQGQEAELAKQATHDIVGVYVADFILLINSSKSEGKAVEQGLAIAMGKHILAVGKLGECSKNVFHYLPNYVWIDTLEEALKVIQGAMRAAGHIDYIDVQPVEVSHAC